MAVGTSPAPSVTPVGPKSWAMSAADQPGGHNPVKIMASPQSSKGISMGPISFGGSSVAGAAKCGRFFLGGAPGGVWAVYASTWIGCASRRHTGRRGGGVSPVPTPQLAIQAGGSGRRILHSVPTSNSAVVYASMQSTPSFPYSIGTHVIVVGGPCNVHGGALRVIAPATQILGDGVRIL